MFIVNYLANDCFCFISSVLYRQERKHINIPHFLNTVLSFLSPPFIYFLQTSIFPLLASPIITSHLNCNHSIKEEQFSMLRHALNVKFTSFSTVLLCCLIALAMGSCFRFQSEFTYSSLCF